MVGGDPFITKSVLHVTRSPWSIASVTDDVEEVFGRYVIDGAMRAAGDGDMTRAIRSRGGSKDAFWADITPYESGSDHWIYQEGGFAIPSIYLRDHPDIYIHTTGDLADNIEPTKIKRSAFIAAASGYYLAAMPEHGAALLRLSYANANERLAEDGRRAVAMVSDTASPGSTAARDARNGEAVNIVAQGLLREQRRLRSLSRFVDLDGDLHFGTESVARLSAALADTVKGLLAMLPTAPPRTPADARIPVRNAGVKGPLAPGGDWVREKAGAASVSIAIGRVPNSDDVTYEIVNFVDGVRTVSEIRDAVSAEFEPLELAAVAEYLDLLAKAGAVSFQR
jgi:aminopeptidase YwaD